MKKLKMKLVNCLCCQTWASIAQVRLQTHGRLTIPGSIKITTSITNTRPPTNTASHVFSMCPLHLHGFRNPLNWIITKPLQIPHTTLALWDLAFPNGIKNSEQVIAHTVPITMLVAQGPRNWRSGSGTCRGKKCIIRLCKL